MVTVIDGKTIADAVRSQTVYHGCIEYDKATDTVYYLCWDYADEILLYPDYEIVEQGDTYVVVRRSDGAVFKVVESRSAEILLNIYINPGRTLRDIIGLETMIEAKENPEGLQSEEDIVEFVQSLIERIAYLAYKTKLIIMKK